MNAGQLTYRLNKGFEVWKGIPVDESGACHWLYYNDAFKALYHLENAYMWLSDTLSDTEPELLADRISDEHPVLLEKYEWGVLGISVPTFTRKKNNCWFMNSATKQIGFRKLYSSVKKCEPASNGRYLAFIRHNTKYSPFLIPPNPVECHALVNGMAYCIATSDSPDVMDFAITTHHDPNSACEYCEIAVISYDHMNIIQQAMNGNILNTKAKINPRNSPEELKLLMDGLRHISPDTALGSMSMEQRINLLNIVGAFLSSMRSILPYSAEETYCQLHSRGLKSTALRYRDILHKHPFAVEGVAATKEVRITSDVKLMNRQHPGSAFFAEELISAIKQNDAVSYWLAGTKYHFQILRKALPQKQLIDGDNTPFNAIAELLVRNFKMQIRFPIVIKSNPLINCETEIILTP